jgi:hypothetical protein
MRAAPQLAPLRRLFAHSPRSPPTAHPQPLTRPNPAANPIRSASTERCLRGTTRSRSPLSFRLRAEDAEREHGADYEFLPPEHDAMVGQTALVC